MVRRAVGAGLTRCPGLGHWGATLPRFAAALRCLPTVPVRPRRRLRQNRWWTLAAVCLKSAPYVRSRHGKRLSAIGVWWDLGDYPHRGRVRRHLHRAARQRRKPPLSDGLRRRRLAFIMSGGYVRAAGAPRRFSGWSSRDVQTSELAVTTVSPVSKSMLTTMRMGRQHTEQSST